LCNQTQHSLKKYHITRNKYIHSIHLKKKAYTQNILQARFQNIKKMWAILIGMLRRNIQKLKSISLRLKGNQFTDNVEMANVFNYHFTNIAGNLMCNLPDTNSKHTDFLQSPIFLSMYPGPALIKAIQLVYTMQNETRSKNE